MEKLSDDKCDYEMMLWLLLFLMVVNGGDGSDADAEELNF